MITEYKARNEEMNLIDITEMSDIEIDCQIVGRQVLKNQVVLGVPNNPNYKNMIRVTIKECGCKKLIHVELCGGGFNSFQKIRYNKAIKIARQIADSVESPVVFVDYPIYK